MAELEVVDAVRLWEVWQNGDMTEGRGPMVPTRKRFATEQEAWDSINTAGGVSGTRPEIAYPGTGASTWQEFKRLAGAHGHYDVRSVIVAREEAGDLMEATTFPDLPRYAPTWFLDMVGRPLGMTVWARLRGDR